MRKMLGRLLLFILFLSTFALPFSQASAENTTVYKVPVKKVVEKGLLAFMERSFSEAEAAEADAIILELHTPGGFVNAAGDIAKLIDQSPLRVIAYINDDAHSAGAFIALYADEIYMSPRGTIGAAQVVDSSGNAADAKADSAWRAAMQGAAESSDREVIYAQAMADPSINLVSVRRRSR